MKSAIASPLVACALTFTTFPATAQSDGVPAEIVQYYADHSFVTAYSTSDEQRRLAQIGADEDVVGVESVRHRAVFAAMQRLRARELAVDPMMALSPSGAWADIFLTPQPVSSHDGRIMLKVTGFRIAPEAVNKLIADYEHRGMGGAPGPLSGIPALLPLTQIHHWVQVGDQWYRQQDVLRELH